MTDRKQARKLDRLADDLESQAWVMNRWAQEAAATGDLARMAQESDAALRSVRTADRYRAQAEMLRQ